MIQAQLAGLLLGEAGAGDWHVQGLTQPARAGSSRSECGNLHKGQREEALQAARVAQPPALPSLCGWGNWVISVVSRSSAVPKGLPEFPEYAACEAEEHGHSRDEKITAEADKITNGEIKPELRDVGGEEGKDAVWRGNRKGS